MTTIASINKSSATKTDLVKQVAKSTMSWAERMAALPEEERAAARAKAALASRNSRARKQGVLPATRDRQKAEAKRDRLTAKLNALSAEIVEVEAELAAAITAEAEQQKELADATA